MAVVSGVGAAVGGIGGPGWAGVAGAITGGVATAFMEGATWTDIINNTISGGISGLTGSSIANLLTGTTMSGMQAAATTGIMSGMIDALLLGAEPIFTEPCKK